MTESLTLLWEIEDRWEGLKISSFREMGQKKDGTGNYLSLLIKKGGEEVGTSLTCTEYRVFDHGREIRRNFVITQKK